MRPTFLLVCAMLLAGCSSDPLPQPVDEVDEDREEEEITFSPLPPPPWQTLGVNWTGHLGVRVLACEINVANQCVAHDQDPGDTDYVMERPGSWLRGANLTLSWEAEGRITEELGLGLMVMGTCDGCASELIEEVEGRAPLTITTPYLDLALDENRIIHAYVWNASGSRLTPATYTYITPDQAFTLTGTLNIQDGPTDKPASAAN